MPAKTSAAQTQGSSWKNLLSDVRGIFRALKRDFFFCSLRGPFGLVTGGKARGGNPASAPKNQRLLSGTSPNAGNTAWEKKKFGGTRGVLSLTFFHA